MKTKITNTHSTNEAMLTVRMPASTFKKLTARAKSSDFANRSELVRTLIERFLKTV